MDNEATKKQSGAPGQCDEAACVTVETNPKQFYPNLPYAEEEYVPPDFNLRNSKSLYVASLWWSLLLLVSIIIYGIVGLARGRHPTDDNPWFIFLMVALGLYVFYGFCNRTLWFLCNTVEENDPHHELETFNTMRNSAPTFSMRIQCYHYETRTRIVRRNGRSHTERYRVRVNTHSASGSKTYNDWYDMSGPGPTLDDLYVLDSSLVGIQIFLTHEEVLDEATKASFLEQKSLFIQQNNRDKHYDYHEWCDTPGFQKRFLLLDKNRRPWWLHTRWYLVSILFLGVWCFRKTMQTRIAKADWVLRTRVSIGTLKKPGDVESINIYAVNDADDEKNLSVSIKCDSFVT